MCAFAFPRIRAKANRRLKRCSGSPREGESDPGVCDDDAASSSHTLAAFWHPIDADAWRAPHFAAGADAARGARAELEERALRGRLRAGWTRWSAEASVRPAAAWIEDVQHALIGPRGVCAHTDGEGGSAWATFARRICLSVSGCTLWIGTRLAATCLAMRRRVSGVNASRDRDLFIARIRARLEEVVLVCLWSLTGPL